jgi:multicomponent K+:H+ antiporter subunit A
VIVTLLLALLALRDGAGPGPRPVLPLAPTFAGLWIVGGAAAIGAAWMARRHRLAAVMLAGVAGVAVSLTFIWFSAPDLALTQLTVEAVATMLILLGLRWLPRRDRAIRPGAAARPAALRRARDLLVAVSAGGGLATLAYAAATRNLPPGPSSSSARSRRAADETS